MVNYIFLVITVAVNWFVIAVACSIFTKDAEIWSLVITGSIIALAISPLAEWINRQVFGCRPVTKEEKEIIERAWSKVFEAAGRNLSQEERRCYKSPEIYISEQKFPNAYAMGSKTICVTRGLLSSAGNDVLAGVLAHEMGHLHHGDSRRRSIVVAMNLAGNIASMVLIACVALLSIFDRRGFGGLFVFSAIFLKAVLWVLNRLIDFGYLAIGRNEEFRADAYAKSLGFGPGLEKYLNRVKALDVAPVGLWAALSRTHPPVSTRIDKLNL